MMNDSKSATSLTYRLSGNGERTRFTMMGNTRQTYIWTESNKTIQQKTNQNKTYQQEQFQQTIDESRAILPGKI